VEQLWTKDEEEEEPKTKRRWTMIGEVMLLPEKWKRKQGSGYLFFFRWFTLLADFHFPTDIQYFSRNSRYVQIWPSIWSGTK